MNKRGFKLNDWVLADGLPVRVTSMSALGGLVIGTLTPFASVERYYADNVMALSRGARPLRCIEPIPLTPSLMNAFKADKCVYRVWYTADDFTEVFVRIAPKRGESTITPHPNGVVVYLAYVHELQHLLEWIGEEVDVHLTAADLKDGPEESQD